MAADGTYVEGSKWFYAPNKGAPIFFAIAFAASGLVHAWQCRRYRSWKLTGLYVLCALIFAAGYAVREVGAYHYDNLVVLICSVCLVYAAPPLYELANYVVLGRILYFVPYHSPIHPGRVLTTFLALSSIVEALNGNGAAYASNQSLPQNKQDIGHALLKAALLLQIIVAVLFVMLAAVFHRRCIRGGIHNAKVNQSLITLYISSGIITVRTIYRTIEFYGLAQLHFDGNIDPNTISPLIRYEWFFYVFEATLMLLNTVLINVRHPRRFLPSSNKIYLSRDGTTEIIGPGYKDDRNFFATLIDPFDIYGMITGKDNKTKFWEENTTGGGSSVANGNGQTKGGEAA